MSARWLMVSTLVLLSARAVAADPSPVPPPPAPPPPPPPLFTAGATADFYYADNLDHPFTGLNTLHLFDVKDSHGPHLGMIDLWAQRQRAPVGYRLELGFGPLARLVNSLEPSHSDLLKPVLQGYVSANLNHSGSTYLDVGKWYSPAGTESAVAQNNWLYSGGVLLGFAVPAYHFGARAFHYFSDADYVMLGIERGWNSVGDPGHDPGFIVSGGKALAAHWLIAGNYLGGAEKGAAGRTGWRSLLNLQASHTAGTQWAYLFEADLGRQAHGHFMDGAAKTARWYGMGGWVKYAFRPNQYAAARVEWYRDESGIQVGVPVTLTTLTGGYTRSLNRYLQVRAEYRQDFSNGARLFAKRQAGTFAASQGTFITAALISY